jgi:hypothetical protein
MIPNGFFLTARSIFELKTGMDMGNRCYEYDDYKQFSI